MGQVEFRCSTVANVFVDGIELKRISSGVSKFELPEGKHRICVKFAWVSSKSVDVEVRNDTTNILLVTNYKGEHFIYLGGILTLVLMKLTKIFALVYLLIPLGVYVLYKLIIDAKNYYSLEHIVLNKDEDK
ncbi:hypothetical protein OAT16_05300 [Prolixibacteraceae bacterium]|nr:hypothetical protein [Prolixibacteraceae bacterium]